MAIIAGSLGSGIGATLSDGTDNFTQIISIGIAGQMIDITDISSSGSTSAFKEFLPGLADAGYIVCVLRYGETLGDAADPAYNLLDITYRSRTVADTWTITFPGGATWACRGFLQKLGAAMHYRNGMQQQGRIKLTGVPTFTEAS